jgi:hypothetical protein
MKGGHVYVIEELPLAKEKPGPWCKIGYTKNPPEWRLEANLKRGNPRTLVIKHDFKFLKKDEALAAEKAAHEHFKEYLHEKEWFNIDSESIATWFQQVFEDQLIK